MSRARCHNGRTTQLGRTSRSVVFKFVISENHIDLKSVACTAYSRYILDIGASEDWLALQIAMFPCLLGYHHIAKRLSLLQDPSAPKTANRYRQWIDNYIADDYTQAVGKGMGKLFINQMSREVVLTSLQNWLRATYPSNLHRESKN